MTLGDLWDARARTIPPGLSGLDGRMEADELEQLLERVHRGEEEAAKTLLETLYPQVRRIVRSHLPRRTAEEDLTQEVFLRLLSRLDQYAPRDGVPFEHWVSRLATRVCLDALRAEKRRPELRWADLTEADVAWLDYLNAVEPAPPESSGQEAREIVLRLLAELAPEDRLILNLLDLERRSVKEIAALTGMNATLIKVRAFRARHKLRRLARTLDRGDAAAALAPAGKGVKL